MLRKLLKSLEPAGGFEPPTCALRVRCSTPELHRLCLYPVKLNKAYSIQKQVPNNKSQILNCLAFDAWNLEFDFLTLYPTTNAYLLNIRFRTKVKIILIIIEDASGK